MHKVIVWVWKLCRALHQWDFDREGAAVNWYHALYRDRPSTSDVDWWFSETHVDFVPALYPDISGNGERISRRDLLESHYDAARMLKNVSNCTLELPLETARPLRVDLERVGWRCEEFDSRTWLLRGPVFRLMLLVQPEGAKSRVKSIGFETNPAGQPSARYPISNGIELSFDAGQAGWLEFK